MREEPAWTVRDAAMRLIAAHGEWKQLGPVRAREARVGRFVLWHWTPFGTGARTVEDARRLKGELSRWGVTPPEERIYGLEVWRAMLGKVAALEWNGDEPPLARLYLPGPWQEELLRLSETMAD